MSDVPAERTSSRGAGTPTLRQYTFNVEGTYTWSVWSEDLISAMRLLVRLMAEQLRPDPSPPEPSPLGYTRSLNIRIHIWDPASAIRNAADQR